MHDISQTVFTMTLTRWNHITALPVRRVRSSGGGRHVEVITEMPKRKIHASAGRGARRRPFSDIGLTMVDEGGLPPASAFRAGGNESIFRFEAQANCGKAPLDLVETTLRAARERNAGRRASQEHDLTFMTAVDVPNEDDSSELNCEDAGSTASPCGVDEAEGMSGRLLRPAANPIVRGNPVKLRTALNALRFTLKHPVTSSMDNPARSPQGRTNIDRKDCSLSRKTAAARARQLPRRPYLLRRDRSIGPDTKSPGDLGTLNAAVTSMNAATDAGSQENCASD